MDAGTNSKVASRYLRSVGRFSNVIFTVAGTILRLAGMHINPANGMILPKELRPPEEVAPVPGKDGYLLLKPLCAVVDRELCVCASW